MKKVILNHNFCPKGTYNLVRLGKINDSGYLVEKRDIFKSDIIISLGLSMDWSFEEDFLKYNDIPLEGYDATSTIKIFFKMIVISILTLNKQNFFQYLKGIFLFRFFFRNNKIHKKLMVGSGSWPGFVTLESILRKHSGKKVFLKADIEGWEYRILNDIITNSHRFTGIVIEFHDFDLHQDKILKFLKKISLKIAHVHVNNYGQITSSKTPMVVEITFSSHKPVSNNKLKFPHTLDYPNDKYRDDYQISFK